MKGLNWAALAVVMAWLGLLAPSAQAVSEEDLLPVDQAYVLSAKAVGRERVEFTWRIEPGYYLYRHRFGAQAATASA